VEQQQQRHQAVAAHPPLADVHSESVQAAIRRPFDASIMLEDSAFRNFVGALCKLSSKMVNIPSASTSAMSLVTPRTERFSRRRVSAIHIPRTLVRYVHLPLSTVRRWPGRKNARARFPSPLGPAPTDGAPSRLCTRNGILHTHNTVSLLSHLSLQFTLKRLDVRSVLYAKIGSISYLRPTVSVPSPTRNESSA
jgi:hypothetical protein